MIHTPSPYRFRRILCSIVGHFLRVNDSRGWAMPLRWNQRWGFQGSPTNLAGCGLCGEIWNDLPIEAKTPMRAVGKCRKCSLEVFASTKDKRVFASCACYVKAGIHKYPKLAPILNGRPS